MASFVEANRLYNEGRYQEALNEYLRLEKVFGSQIVNGDIQRCKDKLGLLMDSNKKIVATPIPNIKKNTNCIDNSLVNEHFDKVYVVNLDFQIEKRLKVCNHLKNNGIKYEVFKAKNGYASPIKNQFDEYIKKPLGGLTRYPEWNEREKKRGKHYIETAGAMGYIYTYLDLIKQAKSKNLKRILILEDDILLNNNFEQDFAVFIKSIDNDWKVLQLGASQYNWDSVNHDEAMKSGFYLPRLLDTCGSFAIAIDLSIADELITELESFEAPFDHLPLGTIYEKYLGKCYVCYPNIIMPDVGVSYIRGERNQYDHSKKMRWLMDNFNYPLQKISVGLIITDKTQVKYINSFNDSKKSVYNLKLYYESKDGIRPIHNLNHFVINEDVIINHPNNLLMMDLGVDILGKVIGKIPITERDIVAFIQSYLNITSEHIKSIEPLNFTKNDYISDMVSVVIPTYKRKETVMNAIRSVVIQDYDLKEIIVVSDNNELEYSEYLSKEIDLLKQEYPNVRIQYIQHSINRNGSAARNTGIYHSKGEYICFLDDDDLYLQGRLSKSIEVLKKNKYTKSQAVYCGFLGWNSPENNLNRYAVGDLTKDLLMINYKAHYLHTNTGTYTRNAIMKLQGFDESYRRHQDFEFSLRYFELYEIDVAQEALVRLKPEPVQNSNILKGFEFINLKIKFLSQFDNVIGSFGEPIAKEIYQIHYNDLLRYCDLNDISEHGFDLDFKNVWLYLLKKRQET